MTDGGGQAFKSPVHLQVTSEPAHIATARRAVQEVAESIGFGEEDVAAVTLAINEALANVIQHGYGGQPGHPIEVTIESVRRGSAFGLQITVDDCCPHVDPSTIVGRDLEDVRPGGLGTHIIRTTMDEVEYMQRQPEGMSLRMVKILGAPPAQTTGRHRCDEEDSADGRS